MSSISDPKYVMKIHCADPTRHGFGLCGHFGRKKEYKFHSIIKLCKHCSKPLTLTCDTDIDNKNFCSHSCVYKDIKRQRKESTPENLKELLWDKEYRVAFNEYRRKLRTMKAWLMRWHRVEKGCYDCGEKDSDLLTFDHENGDKEFDLARGVNVSMVRLLKEIQKCAVVCFNCHMKRERQRNPLMLPPIINWVPLKRRGIK